MKTRMYSLIGVLFLLAAASAQGASISLDFDSSLIYAQAGDTVTFSGMITNTGMGTVYLNGDNYTFPLPVDDTPFFLNVPPLLMAGGSYSGPLFDVMVPFATPNGLYVGSFSVIGGDSAASSDILATRDFGVRVVPEPGTAGLVLLAAAGVVFFRRHQASARP